MKGSNYSIIVVLAVMAFVSAVAYAQNDTFAAPNVNYSFSLPDPAWKMIVRPSDTNPNVEYVYGDRLNGHFEVRKVTVPKGSLLTDIFHNDEEQKLQFLPGYVAGKEETFAGKLRGLVFSYEFVKTGRPMSGRIYFLKANDTTLYAIRFTALKDKLQSILNQTDSIARTFGVKPS